MKVLQAFTSAALISLVNITLMPTSALGAEPQFYPNAKYNSTAAGQLQTDIQNCKSKASQYASATEKSPVQKGVRTAAKGAALGALGGAITGNAGRGAGAGAAIGGVVGTTRGIKESGSGNPEFQKYASICLEEKGYKIVGWR